MKILYAVQAIGNGHISRAKQLMPHLAKYGEVDVLLSGSNATLDVGLNAKYSSQGLSLFYKTCGGLSYKQMFKQNSVRKALKDARKLPVSVYDVIINDFDFITSRACKKAEVKSVQFGHQASFKSQHTPRPKSKSFVGEMILQKYAVADQYIGLHFETYDDFIFHPVIKKEILESTPSDDGHITVYLPSYNQHCIETVFKSMPDLQFHWFLHSVKDIKQEGNITFYPISNEHFTNSLITCHGIITGGGFETPAEAFYLKKKLMVIPIRDHYEQICNGVAAEELGAYYLHDIDCSTWKSDIETWLTKPIYEHNQMANDIDNTLEYLFDNY